MKACCWNKTQRNLFKEAQDNRYNLGQWNLWVCVSVWTGLLQDMMFICMLLPVHAWPFFSRPCSDVSCCLQMGSCLSCPWEESTRIPSSCGVHDLVPPKLLKAQSSQVAAHVFRNGDGHESSLFVNGYYDLLPTLYTTPWLQAHRFYLKAATVTENSYPLRMMSGAMLDDITDNNSQMSINPILCKSSVSKVELVFWLIYRFSCQLWRFAIV